MNANSFCEFPDPIVANYLERVRLLSDAQFVALNQLPMLRLVRWNVLTTWWLAPVEIWMWVARATRRRIMRQFGMAGCSDHAARRAYQDLWADLTRRGASPIGEMHIAMGLQVVRFRNVLPGAPEKYAKHIGAFVPRSSIGWTAHEASA